MTSAPLPPKRLSILAAFVLGLAALLALDVLRGDEDPPPARPAIAPGAAVPDFALRDLAGSEQRLSGLRGPKAVVLAWSGIGCPIAEHYAGRLEALHAAYRERGVRFFGVNSNALDRVEDLRRFASRHRLSFPILKDHDARVAELLGVERTTEVLLLDGELTLRYRGRIDDQYAITARSVGVRKSKAEARFLEDALEAVLAGKAPAIARTEAAGCLIGKAPKASAPSGLTYHEDVEPIIQRRCQSCHREGEIAPFPLLSYDDVSGWAGMVREVVLNRRMPPWHADPEHGRFSNDRSLPKAELETLVRWIDAGAPRGDPAKAPPARTFATGWQIGEPDAVFEIPEPFEIPATGRVRYKYASIETRFDEDRWVEASEVQAGDRSVVHHILVFAQDPQDPRRWRRETGGGTRGYFAVLVPGERPTSYPEGMGKRLPAGATLIFQIHYTTNGTATRDRSRIGFRFAKKPVAREVQTRTAFNQVGLMVPAGAERHPITATHRFHRPATLLSLLPHMHLRGESFRYELHLPARARLSKDPEVGALPAAYVARVAFDAERMETIWSGSMPDEVREALLAQFESAADRAAIEGLARDGRSVVLLNVPRYDFGWQSDYVLAEPLRVPAGALLECLAHFNNSASNPALTEAMVSKPVFWGEQTWEEMMIGYFDCVEDEAR